MSRRGFVPIAVFVVGLWAQNVLATPILVTNERQVTVNAIANEPSLQSLIDAIFGPGVNAATDQSSAAMWTLASGSSLNTNLSFEYAGNHAVNVFGLWSGLDTSSIYKLPVFLGPAVGSGTAGAGLTTYAAVEWTANGTGVTISGDCAKGVNCGTFTSVDPRRFGVYLQVGNTGNIFFTADQLNPNGTARALAFRKPSTDDWVIAFEDYNDMDYNDGVLNVRNLTPTPVPEPSTMVLVTSGLIGMVRRLQRGRRRRTGDTA